MTTNEPLLARSSSEDFSENTSIDSTWPLQSEKKKSSNNRYRKWIIGGCAITIASVIGLAIGLSFKEVEAETGEKTAWISGPHQKSTELKKKPKNVIMMISDGLGPASVAFARTYYQIINNQPYDFEMPLDKIHIGQSRTRSASTLVTDSAAGATAFSCNLKTFNGAVGVGPTKNPCGTVLESAKHSRHMLTGLVATSRITHATPASFSAHVENRDNENAIAKQQVGDNPLGRSLDLMFGGGYCHFLPKTEKHGCRFDGRHLFNEAKSTYNWTTVLYGDKQAYDQLPEDRSILPVISLFSPDHLAYEIDRDATKEPSLSEMSRKALDILFKATEDREEGFFLMIEGSRIDMAAHSNDAPTHVHEILEYQKTVELVMGYVDDHPDTIMISTSDHETGGLSLARQVSKAYPEYLWYPDVLTKVKSSASHLAKLIKAEKSLHQDFIVQTILQGKLGITDATEDEIHVLMKPTISLKALEEYLADMISIRAQLGWATHGHSGVDVNLYAYGEGTDYLIGSHENIQIGEFITKALDLNLTEVTSKLNSNNASFHLTQLTPEGKLEYNEDLEHYHHVPSHLKHSEL